MKTAGARYSFEFILSDQTYQVRDEDELSLVFELLAKTPGASVFHWNTIVSLDDKLLQIIKTHTGLAKCLKPLTNKNRFLLFVKIGDNLAQIIRNSNGFARLMATMPETVDQERLVKIFRSKGLLSISNTPADLGKMFEWANEPTERMMLAHIGAETIRSLISSAKDLYKILHFMHPESRRYFMEMIGWEFLQSRVFSADDFFFALKAIDLDDIERFLGLFSPDWIRSVIANEYALREYLMKLSFTKQDPLLRHLGYDPNLYNAIV